MNREAEIQFRAAAIKAKTVPELIRALPKWSRESVLHFNAQTGLNLPFVRPDPDPKAKALPPAQGRACPKPGPKKKGGEA